MPIASATRVAPRAARNPSLRKDQTVSSPISGFRYRVLRKLGEGGFGAAYLTEVVGTGGRVCCLKICSDPFGWHGEAYFGHLMQGVAGAVQVYESFAWTPPAKRQPLYCLVTEFAEQGDVAAYLQATREPWGERYARRELIRLSRTVGLLHQAGAVHRDITPRNVFVTAEGELKLGDFGFAAHRVGRRNVRADFFAPGMAPTRIQNERQATWSPADDVYHLGQLYAFLLQGRIEKKLKPGDVKRLSCSPDAKAVIQRCIGVRRKRFESAAEMLQALERQERRSGETTRPRIPVRTLHGKGVVFTGSLTILRTTAVRLLKRAGGVPQNRVGQQTDVVVVGGTSPSWKADLKGQKLLDVELEFERGHNIAVIREARFLQLVDRRVSARR